MANYVEGNIGGDVIMFWSNDVMGTRDDRSDYIIIPVMCLDRLAHKNIRNSEFVHALIDWANTNYDNFLQEEEDERQWLKRRYDAWHERCNSSVCDYVCAYCGKDIDDFGHIDHIFPKSRGGKGTFENTVSACPNCNEKKGARTPEEANMPIKFGMLNLLRVQQHE